MLATAAGGRAHDLEVLRRELVHHHAAVLAVGAASERPVAKDGAVTTATMMTCSLSVDHRVADGVAVVDRAAAR